MDFFKELFKFLIAKEHSFASKFIGFLIVVLTLIFIDNLLGFSFYYSNNQKIEQIKTIETLKKECADERILKTINETELNIIERKNIIEIFFSLFSKKPIDIKTENTMSKNDTVYIVVHDTIKQIEKRRFNPFDTSIIEYKNLRKVITNKSTKYDSIRTKPPISSPKDEKTQMKSRSQLWHTITSSYGFVFLLIILPFVPFTEKKFSWNTMIGMIFIMALMAGLIWFNQYLFGLIPVILNSPWLNYTINIIVHTLILIIIGIGIATRKTT